MNPVQPSVAQPELYPEIFGSILDRNDMSPYLLRPAIDYRMALRQATKMLLGLVVSIPANSIATIGCISFGAGIFVSFRKIRFPIPSPKLCLPRRRIWSKPFAG
jgi:hypothetical protein